mmetsp:Transcript_14827/g.26789  ORF Transcript_14827/g.26789 Transcript_14827/m.26789 type:complete len:526 (-) Transcript_14827:443-2020(-)
MSNLSELSIQLRKLQSEKNAQANEIDRLQRQLRILSELKGVSVSDVQTGLQAACEAEAHGELRAIAGKLQARVDGLELGGAGGSSRKFANGGGFDGDDKNIPTQNQFNEEAAARARTNLQLRIGELQEIESNLRGEMNSLYENFQALTERNTNLQTQLLQTNVQLSQWELRWKAKEEEESQRSTTVPINTPATTGSYNYSQFATSNKDAESQPILLHNASQSEVDAEHEQRLIAVETALAGEKQQRSLVVSQLSSTQKSYELKAEQYLHRIQFLEEQLKNLEQQMSSLYVAFGIIQDDSKEERDQKEAWKQTQIESDAAMAKQETKREKQQFSPSGRIDGERRASSSDHSSRRGRVKQLLSSPLPSAVKASVKPAAHPPIAQGELLLLLDKDDQPLQPNDAPSTPRQKPGRKLPLRLSRSSSKRFSSAPNFKKQYCVLHGANGLYQIRYGDTYAGPVSGVHEFITAGVSSIDHTHRSSGQQFGFEVMINASVMDAPALCCAAETEADFMRWMAALMSVIDGSMDT